MLIPLSLVKTPPPIKLPEDQLTPVVPVKSKVAVVATEMLPVQFKAPSNVPVSVPLMFIPVVETNKVFPEVTLYTPPLKFFAK